MILMNFIPKMIQKDIQESSKENLSNPENVKRNSIFERWTEKFKEFLDKA